MERKLTNGSIPPRSQHATRTLAEPREVEHTYRRHTCGPGGYAHVKVRCEPSSEAQFGATAKWPVTLGRGYIASLERAVEKGVAQAFSKNPAKVCRVVLVDVQWDNVQSSEKAFLEAAAEAIVSVLNDEAAWTVNV